MTFSTSRRSARAWQAIRFAALAIIALLVAHDAVFALRFGVGQGMDAAMSESGHDGWWTPLTIAVAILGGVLAAGACVRVVGLSTRLGAQAAGRARGVDCGAMAAPPAEPAVASVREVAYGPELLRLWRGLLACVTAALVVQENLEHLLSQGQLPGLEPLAGPLTIPALVVVSFVFAALGALVRWRISILQRRIAATCAGWPRASAALPPDGSAILAALLAHRWLLVRRGPGRAPPAVVVL